ncbi:hypothetical protein [Arenimonas sp. MALMAid1274]|uniref:hypothetical protein n=1 Tax=Arenimonas sp. MALMAid1274 TaxID=3411630 RepID=UPI003BA3A0F0
MSDNELRWQLRQLPREIDPPRDLWPGIESRLTRGVPARPSRPWRGWAVAASLCLAAGLAWQLRGPDAPRADPQASVVQREAEAMTREYEAALGQFDGLPLPAPIEPALATLDRSAVEIRAALATDPQATFLLDQLRRTYARRLDLTQRALTG